MGLRCCGDDLIGLDLDRQLVADQSLQVDHALAWSDTAQTAFVGLSAYLPATINVGPPFLKTENGGGASIPPRSNASACSPTEAFGRGPPIDFEWWGIMSAVGGVVFLLYEVKKLAMREKLLT